MEAGFRAAWVIPWADVTVDGVRAPRIDALAPGAAVAWTGEAQAIVNPGAPLRLERPSSALQGRTARGLLQPPDRFAPAEVDAPDPSVPHHLILTDGRRGHLCRLAEGPQGWLCIFDRPPPTGAFWVAGLHLPAPPSPGPADVAGLLAGTPVLTPRGPCDVARLAPGARVVTRDGGALPLAGVRVAVFGGGRLYAEPSLRPVRLADQGDGPLCVAPAQPVMVSGAACAACFLTPDVLVRAADLIDELACDRRAAVDLRTRRAVYVTPVLPVPALILAAGRWVAADTPPLRLLTRAEAAILRARTD
jgi:hypothetical protein